MLGALALSPDLPNLGNDTHNLKFTLQAMRKAVSPFLHCASRLAPLLISNCMSPLWALLAAAWSGVNPFWGFAEFKHEGSSHRIASTVSRLKWGSHTARWIEGKVEVTLVVSTFVILPRDSDLLASRRSVQFRSDHDHLTIDSSHDLTMPTATDSNSK